jgi:hypothetical protein
MKRPIHTHARCTQTRANSGENLKSVQISCEIDNNETVFLPKQNLKTGRGGLHV